MKPSPISKRRWKPGPTPRTPTTTWGTRLCSKGRVDEAISHYQKALQIKPDDPHTPKQSGLATGHGAGGWLRDGGRAVELARQANTGTGGENPVILRKLAAACAEAGRFPEAVETGQEALRLAQAQSNTGLAAALESELKFYQAGSPFHSPEQPH